MVKLIVIVTLLMVFEILFCSLHNSGSLNEFTFVKQEGIRESEKEVSQILKT